MQDGTDRGGDKPSCTLLSFIMVWPVRAVNWGLRSPNSNDNNAYYINTDGTVNNNNVYNANFAPRPALMEHRVQVPRPGESRGPSSKEAISCRGKLHGGRSEPGRTHGIDADGPDTGGRPPGTSMEGGAASYQRCPALLRIQTE